MHHDDIPPRPRGGVPAHCVVCGRFFWSLTSLIRRGIGRCCSRACANRARTPYGPRTSYQQTFWARVRQHDGCWEWLGVRDRNGYGQICKPGTRRYVFAHRVSWELHHGPIPAGMGVLHHCDNPPCCNPDHLFLGTQRDNMRDMQRKGRGVRGERVGSAKLTADQVRDFRRRHAAGERVTDLAQEAGVSQPTMSNLLSRETWKHLD